MKQILWKTSDAIVLAIHLYRELALSALTLLPRRERTKLSLAAEPSR
jgi:hypothetical protein